MGNHWKRWRAYMDELEEAMRWAGDDLSWVEWLSAEEHQRRFWRRPQREARLPRLLALAREIPFLKDLVAEAARWGPDAELPPPPEELIRWPEESSRRELPSRDRDRLVPPEGETSPGASAPAAPARLRSAERALAHRTRSLTVVLERLTSPRNASAIVRTAEALGLQEVHFIDPRGRLKLNPGTTRMGHRWMDLCWHRDTCRALDGLKRRGYQVAAADFGPSSIPLDRLPLHGKIAVVLGSEQEGVSRTASEHADVLFHLPTVGFTSYLNVSVTAGIVLHGLDLRLRAEGLRAPLDPEDSSRLRAAWYALLAGENPARRAEYARWLENPPSPAPRLKPVPSREKARQHEDDSGKQGTGKEGRR